MFTILLLQSSELPDDIKQKIIAANPEYARLVEENMRPTTSLSQKRTNLSIPEQCANVTQPPEVLVNLSPPLPRLINIPNSSERRSASTGAERPIRPIVSAETPNPTLLNNNQQNTTAPRVPTLENLNPLRTTTGQNNVSAPPRPFTSMSSSYNIPVAIPPQNHQRFQDRENRGENTIPALTSAPLPSNSAPRAFPTSAGPITIQTGLPSHGYLPQAPTLPSNSLTVTTAPQITSSSITRQNPALTPSPTSFNNFAIGSPAHPPLPGATTQSFPPSAQAAIATQPGNSASSPNSSSWTAISTPLSAPLPASPVDMETIPTIVPRRP